MLLMLDVQEVVEVVTQEQDELPPEEVKIREDVQKVLWAEPARGSAKPLSVLADLQLLWSHMCSVREKASRTNERLRSHVAERLRHNLARRR